MIQLILIQSRYSTDPVCTATILAMLRILNGQNPKPEDLFKGTYGLWLLNNKIMETSTFSKTLSSDQN